MWSQKLDKKIGVVATAAGTIMGGLLSVQATRAQDPTDWQTIAGGKMAFEVASVKPARGPVAPPHPSLTPWDDHSATDGRFRAESTLSGYIQFAYKLWPNDAQNRELSRLPRWVDTDRYSVEARAPKGNPTKDQMRLMMQSLLADRFQLAARFEARTVPVFELGLTKTGKMGPGLVPHAAGPPCDKPGRSPADGLPGFPADCHSLAAMGKPGSKLVMVGARDVTMDVLAGAFSGAVPLGLDRPLIDKTGLRGTFDFTLEWEPAPRTPAVSDSPLPSPPLGPTPLEALRDQLGLKLQPAKASIPILVIDKVARPSEN